MSNLSAGGLQGGAGMQQNMHSVLTVIMTYEFPVTEMESIQRHLVAVSHARNAS